jgi:uncharacterized protein YjbI with pentapeptide repeats
MPSPPSSDPPVDSPRDLIQLRAALQAGQRRFPGLQLGDLDGVDLDLADCELEGGCFKEARFGHASLRAARVEGCCFQQALLWGADLSDLHAVHSFWQETDLSAARLQGADLSFALMQGVQLHGADLRGACLYGANLSGADLQQADLSGCDLRDTNLSGAKLEGANLENAALSGGSRIS